MLFSRRPPAMVDASSALPGRSEPLAVPERHEVLGTPLRLDAGQTPEGLEQAVFGMGCFWGAERIFWQAPGVYTTAVGYAGGYTPNPTYEEVCSGRTGHAEVVLVAFESTATSYEEMLRLFWEGHDPTQSMRQGADVGTQYRSAIIWQNETQRAQAEASRETYQRMLSAAGHGEITTELIEGPPAHPFYYAESYHQQYLAKNPGGYCGLGGTGVSCPVGLAASG
ncbi:MAG TPA: peptide-methionine (S)-S-oxide reductase MsrA [Solirubrobacteraceae bacterium]|nr:peptide-methionine (S)-S-oxide reductase MsrA [Solirubrobacteraceae bacterium]